METVSNGNKGSISSPCYKTIDKWEPKPLVHTGNTAGYVGSFNIVIMKVPVNLIWFFASKYFQDNNLFMLLFRAPSSGLRVLCI